MIDFDSVAQAMLARAHTLLPEWFPHGKFVGREFMVGNLNGDPGKSLSINTETGLWSDFAADISGHDLIDLYAKKNGMDRVSAVRAYEANYGSDPATAISDRGRDSEPTVSTYTVVPDGITPHFKSRKYGPASMTWTYRSMSGQVIGFVSRHDADDKKHFVPWRWNASTKKFDNRGFPNPKPLYGLEFLEKFPERKILIVEGEKAADAARKLAGHRYIVMTWPNGVNSAHMADWSPVFGHEILLWPDADSSHTYPNDHALAGEVMEYHEQPGPAAMLKIAAILRPHCKIIKILSVADVTRDGWDASDALEEGWNYVKMLEWAKEPNRVSLIGEMPSREAVEDDEPDRATLNKYDLWTRLTLNLNGSGAPHTNMDNAYRILKGMDEFKGKIWYDTFHDNIFTNWRGPARRWDKTLDMQAIQFMQSEVGLSRMGKETVQDAIYMMAKEDIRNELTDFLDSLNWDGVPRLSSLMSSGFNSDDTEYYRRIGECWMISMAARAYEPGCQVDTVPVFEGSQGVGKSTALRIIGGKFFTECHESMEGKDFYMVIGGYWLIELSELSSLSKSGFDKIKGIISNRIDRYRSPFERYVDDHPRQCVFAGTTNRSDWNRDPTGGRRFWPVACGDVDLTWIADWRDQLIAEAVFRYKEGENWHHVPDDEAKKQQAARYRVHPWEAILLEWGDENAVGRYLKTEDFMSEGLKIDRSRMNHADRVIVCDILRGLGYKQKNKRINGKPSGVWIHPESHILELGSNE